MLRTIVSEACAKGKWVSAALVVLATGLAALAQQPVTVLEQGEGRDQRITVENAYLKLVIAPGTGGRIESLVHKASQKDLALPASAGARWGLLCDQLWQQSFEHSDWNRYPYAASVLERGPERARLLLSGRGRAWAGVTINKYITLEAGRAAVDVEYSVSAAAPSNARAAGDLWIYNGLPAGGKVFMPSETGVLERPLSVEPEDWVYGPTRGWMAAVLDGAGLAVAMDFSRLKALRTSQEQGTSLEWLLRKASLKPGSSFKTFATLAPFAGLKRVDGVCRQFAVEMSTGDVTNKKAGVRLAAVAFEACAPNFALSVRRLPDGAPAKAAEMSVALAMGALTAAATEVPIVGEGSYVVSCDASLNGKVVLQCERVIVVGKPSGTYAMAPESLRAGEVPDYPTWSRYHPVDFNFNSMGYETPHRVWAHPYAGGKPRVLFLLNHHDARQAIEMAQRFDMDITVPFITADTYYALGDRYRSLNIKEVHEALERLVLGQTFDVIVMPSGIFTAANPGDKNIKALTPKVKEYIVKLVQEGAGLVMVQRGAEPPELAEAVPLKHQGYDWAAGPYLLEKTSNPVLNALPWEAIPPGHSQNGMKLRPQKADDIMAPDRERDTVLVKCLRGGGGGGPLIATASWGKGRIVQMAINEPLLFNSATVRGRDLQDPPPYDYWEYQYAVFGRLIYWAARKESPVVLREIACSPRTVALTVGCKADGPADVEWMLRDKFGATLHAATQKTELKAPFSAVTLDVPPGLGRYYIADVVLRNEKGTLAWGGGVLRQDGPQIRSLQADKTQYDPKEPAKITAVIQPAPPAGAQLRIEVCDGSGRKAAETVTPAATETVQAAAPLDRVLGVVVEFRAALLAADGAVLDQACCTSRLVADREAQRARFHAAFWGGAGGNYPPFLIRELFRLYQDLGMTANLEGLGPLSHDLRELEYLDMPFVSGSVGMSCNNGVRKADMATRGDAEVFTSPKVPEGLRASAARVARERLGQNTLMFTMGDEQRAPLPDTDFSKVGLAEFRKWLQTTQYQSLADLNAEWQTDFKTWDDVMPMTEAEIFAHGEKTKSYAAWADQQQFNKWIWARNAKAAIEGFASVDPGFRAGESGTQEADTYSGRDYWLIMQQYNALAAYGGDQENQQASFRPDMLRYTWAGYGKPNPVLRTGTWSRPGTIDKGILYFHDKTHIDPDYTLPECGRDLRAMALELMRGQGQLLMQAQVHYEPVYFLQSSASLHGEYAYGHKAYKEIGRGGRAALIDIMNDLVVGYRHLSYEQVAQGQLEKVGAKVLILPFSVALSKEESEAIRRWVQAGGTLINDLDAGIMTQHCRLLPKGQLDDVFGIDRSGAQIRKGRWVASDASGKASFGLGFVETGLRGAARPAWTARLEQESAPVFFVHTFGKGRAVYLACDLFRSYSDASEAAVKPEEVPSLLFVQDALETVLREAGIQMPISTVTRGPVPARVPFLKTFVKTAGEQRYVLVIRDQGVFASSPADLPATVRLGQPAHVYDILAGTELGYGDRLDLTLTDYTVRALALLPYRVRGMNADLPAAAKPGDDVTLRLSVAADGRPGLHVFRVDVTDPKGRPVRWYSRNAVAPQGSVEVKLPFALNDAPGVWTIRVADVATGATALRQVQLGGK